MGRPHVLKSLPGRALCFARRRISEKLGVCPFCMRASALGTLAGWAAYAGARWMHLDAVAGARAIPILIALAASCFTVLISAHLVAYMMRFAREARGLSRVTWSSRAGSKATIVEARSLTRREFIGAVLGAGAYAASIAVFGSAPLSARVQDTCSANGGMAEPPAPDNVAAGYSPNDAQSTRDMLESAVWLCDNFCMELACAGGGRCLRAGPAVLSKADCRTFEGQRLCSATVKRCQCGCNSCTGSHEPRPPQSGFGVGGTQDAARQAAEADARAICDRFCAEFKDCNALTCKRDGDPQFGPNKHWPYQNAIQYKVRIVKCKCKCL